ncbi:hypothetical protein [Lederbergia graminis]|uniref:Uncharacterized protein n=1 Tax=Lederbergia graminis TaxID=735518 RepID=A0ABW0LLU2_9BACI
MSNEPLPAKQTFPIVVKLLMQSPAFKSSDFSRGGLQPLFRIILE